MAAPCGGRGVVAGLLCVMASLWRANAASYKVQPQSAAVLRGQAVTLPCTFSGLTGEDVVVWEGPPDFRIISMGTKVTAGYGRHFVIGDTSAGEYNLQIREVTLGDAGGYRCSTPSVPAAPNAALTVIVPLAKPPEIVGGKRPTPVGQRLLLTCSSQGGYPPPTLSWLNGTKLLKRGKTPRKHDMDRTSLDFVLTKVKKWDNGNNLTCVADQGLQGVVRPLTASKIVSVSYPPTITVPESSKRAKEGDQVNLTCVVDSNPPAVVTWRKLGGTLNQGVNDRGQTLSLPKVSRHDSGIYQCTADNEIPPPGLGTVSLDVLYQSWIDPSLNSKVSVMYGQDGFLLECSASGNPTPRVRWRRKDTSLYWDNPLRFHRVRYDVEGTYQCVATNEGFPATTRDTYVDVVGRPYILQRSTTFTVRRGDTARLSCEIVSDPVPKTIQWAWRDVQGIESTLSSGENGVDITEELILGGKLSTLSINGITEGWKGTYMCKGTNMFGTDQREFRLEVTGSPHTLVIVVGISVMVAVMAAVAAIFVFFFRKKWLGDDRKSDTTSVTVSRPMPPPPGYNKNKLDQLGSLDIKDIDGLIEIHEMNGTLKPRPPPRVDKEWTAIGLSYPGLVQPLPPYSTVDRQQPEGEDRRIGSQQSQPDAPQPPPKARWTPTRSGGDRRCSASCDPDRAGRYRASRSDQTTAA
ncbi:kin of IRRE-like protein 1 isoform X1 [Branchiostoma floridae x Branchiostoma belcheri]